MGSSLVWYRGYGSRINPHDAVNIVKWLEWEDRRVRRQRHCSRDDMGYHDGAWARKFAAN